MKRYSLWVKCLVFFLAVVTLLCVAVSALGILMAESMNMYTQDDYEGWIFARHHDMAEVLADQVMRDYSGQLSGSPQWLLESTGYLYAIENAKGWYDLAEEDWYYTILNPSKKEVRNTYSKNVSAPLNFIFEKTAEYPVIVGSASEFVDNATEAAEMPEAEYDVTAPTVLGSAYMESRWDPNGEEVFITYESKPGYQVNIGISWEYAGKYMNNGLSQSTIQWLFSVRYPMIIVMAGSLLLFVIAFIFLISLAGKDPKTGEANPRALNKLPLDLYLAAAAGITVLGCLCAYELLEELLFYSDNYNVLLIVLLCGCGIIVATIDVGFFSAVAAQFKVPGGMWWRHSVCGRVLKLLWKVLGIGFCYIKKAFRIAGRTIGDFFGMLPLIWEWVTVASILGILLLLVCAWSTAHWYTVGPMIFWCLVFAAFVLYGGYCYGTIQKGIRRMKEGNLNEKIDTQWMYGSFKKIAEDLNALADVVIIAAEKQLKAERMKAELITNVSHDIKTPLTSVINYVDLLLQPHTEEEGEAYLEVLSRQSLRLKKLVEDLMDMSKASSGNMAVNITTVDAVETVNQALGEFADKLEVVNLTPVFRASDNQVHMQADGCITWRVLSNILSNVVKYALPGTRVYLDLRQEERWVVLSVKNISREELNISAEELTERFVRGDASRNTEGSGLGLNIAQSLMRLQRGSLELTVDGDLFKVTLVFPTE